MKTVQDILDLIKANRASRACGALRQHAAGLAAARKFGSTTEIGLNEVPGTTPVEKVDHPNVRPGCDCYRFTYPMGGRRGVISFEEAAAKGPVLFRIGHHGVPELYIKGSADDPSGRNVDTIYVITGPHICEDGTTEQAVFTWHPDEPMRELKVDVFADTAVKVD